MKIYELFKTAAFLLFVFFFYGVEGQNASFNYNTTTGSLGTTYSWIDCSSGTEITNSMWSTSGSYSAYDDGYYNLNFPFSFKFYDDTYTTSDQLSICTNGFIRLDGQADDDYSSATGYDLTSSATSLGQIVGLAIDDCVADNGSGSHVYYRTTGTSPNRVFTIEYHHLEVDYGSGNYANIEVSFYETSNKVVILFGTDDVSTTSSDMGIHSGVSGYYDYWGDVDSQTNNSWIEYDPAKKLSSISYNQASTADVGQGSLNNKILRLDFDVEGGNGTLNLNSIKVTSQNTSDADIASSGVKLYRTTTTTFSTDNQLGTAQSFSSGSATFSSLSYDLPYGTTYIWVCYDISSSATRSNTVDASISSGDINVAGSTYPSSSQSPSGSRTIDWITWDGSSSRDWTVGANWSTGSVPSSSDNVVIPSSPSNQPILYDGDNGSCKDLTIKSGASLEYRNTSGNLKIYGNLINDGTLSGSSATKNVQFYGTNCTIGGSGTWTHNLFRINGGSYSLTDDVSTYKFVVFNSGSFSLGSHKLTITNDFKLKNSGDVMNLNTGTLDLQGNFSDYDGAINSGTGTFVYSGSTSQTIRNGYTYYNLKVKLTAGATRSLSSGALSCTNLELYNTGGSNGTGSLSADLSIAGNLTVGTNCTFDANGHNTTVDGNWVNNGTVSLGTTTVTFDGTGNQSISGTNSFYNLTVNKSSGTLSLSNDISVSHTLTMTSGNISIGSYDLTIGSSATISGAGSSSYIVTGGSGVVKKNYSSTGSFTFPVGDASDYSPFTFDLVSGTIASGSWVSMKVTNSCIPELSSTSYINRNWTLEQNGISGSVAYDCNYTYVQSDVVGNEGDLLPTKNSGGTNYQASSGVNTSTNTVTPPTQGTFSIFGARDYDDGASTLPVEWLSFKGEVTQEGKVLLSWTTASEINNDYFTVERSVNGIDFTNIGKVKGKGSSNVVSKYKFIDSQPFNGINYYRIKQTDYDGKETFSDLIYVEVSGKTSISVYPNPFDDKIIVVSHAAESISIIDITGKTVYFSKIENGRIAIDASNLEKGVYGLRIATSTGIITRKIVKR